MRSTTELGESIKSVVNLERGGGRGHFPGYIITFNMCTHTHSRETTPSSFSLNVYINDSTNPLAPTFDPVGRYELPEHAY